MSLKTYRLPYITITYGAGASTGNAPLSTQLRRLPFPKGDDALNPCKISKPRKQERQILLENDPWASIISPHQVQCLGCNQSISLNRYPYVLQEWRAHIYVCPYINPRANVQRFEDDTPQFAHPQTEEVEVRINQCNTNAYAVN